MNDYDFHKDSLKPTKAYNNLLSPKKSKHKATTERSKSKQKMIVTSFSKKQLVEMNSKPPFNNAAINNKKISSVESPHHKKSPCQSEYYFKTAETKTSVDLLQLHDEIKIRDGQLQELTKRLAKAEMMVNHLKAENELKSDRIVTLEREMSTLLAKSLKSLEVQHIGTDLTYQVEKNKQDQRRMLKMLQKTSEYEYFSKFALMDEGVEFLRFPNQVKKSSLDATLAKKSIHYCSCNKDFISQSSFWVPQKIYSFGKNFIVDRKGQFTKSEYELLMYELNRLWRQRQKKIVNTLNGEKARQLEKYKRRESNSHSLQKTSVYR